MKKEFGNIHDRIVGGRTEARHYFHQIYEMSKSLRKGFLTVKVKLGNDMNSVAFITVNKEFTRGKDSGTALEK